MGDHSSSTPNHISLSVLRLDNLPSSYSTWGVDEKGGVGTKPEHHVFQYELYVEKFLPPPNVSAEGVEEAGGGAGSGNAPLGDYVVPNPEIQSHITRVKTELQGPDGGEDGNATGAEDGVSLAVPAVDPNAPIITWAHTARPVLGFEMTAERQAILQKMAAEGEPLRIHIRRRLRSNVPEGWTDVNRVHHGGVVCVDLAPLAEPGRVQHTWVVPLKPLLEHSLTGADDKTGKKTPTMKKKPKKGVHQPDTLIVPEEEEPGRGYNESGTTATVVIRFKRALVHLPEARPRPQIRPRDLLPRRGPMPRKPQSASELYRTEVASVVRVLCKEWSKGNGVQDFLDSLRDSGLRASLTEGLRAMAQRVLQEQRQREKRSGKAEVKSAFESQRQSDALMSTLTSLMQEEINKMAAEAAGAPEVGSQPREINDPLRWSGMADDAEEMGRFDVAARHHQERLVQMPDSADAWCEYGEFLVRVGDVRKAEQAFKEALGINALHFRSLLTYGLLLLNAKSYRDAEVLLQEAVDVAPQSPLSWGFLGMYMEMAVGASDDTARRLELSSESVYSFQQAQRFVSSTGGLGGGSGSMPSDYNGIGSGIGAGVPRSTSHQLFLLLAETTFSLHLDQMCAWLLAKCGATDVHAQALRAELLLQQENYEKALQKAVAVLEAERTNPATHALVGECQRKLGRIEEALTSYDRALDIASSEGFGGIVDWRVYLHLGDLLLDMHSYEDALDAFIVSAAQHPCGLTWLCCGKAYYRLGMLEEAEQSLTESSGHDNYTPETWAYLSLVCRGLGRADEAEHCYEHAIELQLADKELLEEVEESRRIIVPEIL